jgi:hypothetical protein
MPVTICWSEKEDSSLRHMGADVDFRSPKRMIMALRRRESRLVIMKERSVWGWVSWVGLCGYSSRKVEELGTYASACYSCVCLRRVWDHAAFRAIEAHGWVFALGCCWRLLLFVVRLVISLIPISN